MSFRKEKKEKEKARDNSLLPVSVIRLKLLEPSNPVTEVRKEKLKRRFKV